MQANGAKLIFAGSVGSGKTTAIGCMSDIPTISTDVAATDETLERKETTTVAMDYGFMALEDGQYVHLYGTPGQERFDFMWEILADGALGLVLMVDATREDPVADMEFYLDRFADVISQTAAVIGISRSDIAERDIFERVQNKLLQRGQRMPVFEVDARETDQVSLLVNTLMLSLAASA